MVKAWKDVEPLMHILLTILLVYVFTGIAASAVAFCLAKKLEYKEEQARKGKGGKR